MKKHRHFIRRKLLPPKLLHIPNVNAIRGSALVHKSVSKLLPGYPHLTGCSAFMIIRAFGEHSSFSSVQLCLCRGMRRSESRVSSGLPLFRGIFYTHGPVQFRRFLSTLLSFYQPLLGAKTHNVKRANTQRDFLVRFP